MGTRSLKSAFAFTEENFGELGVHYLFLTIILRLALNEEAGYQGIKDGEVFLKRLVHEKLASWYRPMLRRFQDSLDEELLAVLIRQSVVSP